MEKVILGICTSGSRLNLAVSAGGRTFGLRRKEYNQERVLYGEAAKLLAKAGATLRGVDAVCAARGPGRFTGIRIALTLAGALKAMSGAKVYTATSFEILALQASGTPAFAAWLKANPRGRLAVLLHAFKDEYFCQFFRPGRAAPRPEGEPVWLKSEEMRALLAARKEPLYAAADAEEEAGIYGLLPRDAVCAPAKVSKILPEYVIKAALAGRRNTLKPLYLKPAKYELEAKK